MNRKEANKGQENKLGSNRSTKKLATQSHTSQLLQAVDACWPVAPLQCQPHINQREPKKSLSAGNMSRKDANLVSWRRSSSKCLAMALSSTVRKPATARNYAISRIQILDSLQHIRCVGNGPSGLEEKVLWGYSRLVPVYGLQSTVERRRVGTNEARREGRTPSATALEELKSWS